MSVNWQEIRDRPDCYHIIVRDNYHYQNPDEEFAIIGFATEADALAKCRKIVEKSLQSVAEPGQSAEVIFSRYQMFGDDPSVVNGKDMPPVPFSGWDYAKGQAHKFVC